MQQKADPRAGIRFWFSRGFGLALGGAACSLLDLGLVFAAGSGTGSLGWGGFAGGALDLLALDLVGDGSGVCHDVFFSELSECRNFAGAGLI